MLKRIILALAITSLSTNFVNTVPQTPPSTNCNIEGKILFSEKEYMPIDYIITLEYIKPC